jgi:Transposase, Mutator family
VLAAVASRASDFDRPGPYKARKCRYIGTRKARLQAAWTAALVNLNPTESLGLRVSKSEVSRICSALDEHVEAFRTRSLEGRYPYLFLDARSKRSVTAVAWSQRRW